MFKFSYFNKLHIVLKPLQWRKQCFICPVSLLMILRHPSSIIFSQADLFALFGYFSLFAYSSCTQWASLLAVRRLHDPSGYSQGGCRGFTKLFLQSVSWSLAEFFHNKIVNCPRKNCLNVCRQLQRKVRCRKHDV